LPIDALKIDRSFINNMATDPGDMAIVSAIISLAHSLNLSVVAEGVETLQQHKLLERLDCDEVQGYLYSRPLPAEQIQQTLPGRRGMSEMEEVSAMKDMSAMKDVSGREDEQAGPARSSCLS
jgi:EAL domain-containing protein (putative c-di-GMP-specific phosphodiesterase class I)